MRIYKIEYYVPVDYLEKVNNEIFKAGAGKIGNYDCCCWFTKGTGQFRPCNESRPFIGKINELEKMEEYKVELVCEEKFLEKVIETLIKNHPYEIPAYQFWPVNH